MITNVVNKIEEKRFERGNKGEVESYSRLQIDLGNAAFVGTNIEIAVSGSYLAKILYSGTDYGTYFRLDQRHEAIIYANEFQSVNRRFEKLYLTNVSAQTGCVLVLEIGHTGYSEIKPDVLNNITHVEDTGHVTGKDRGVMLLGVRLDTPTVMTSGEGDYSPITVDKYGRLITVPEVMNSYGFYAIADTGTAVIAAPGVGYALEVCGYQIMETENAAFVVSTQASCKFVTSNIYIWRGIPVESGSVQKWISSMNNIKVRGADNEALTITNADRTAGESQVVGVVFYRTVVV